MGVSKAGNHLKTSWLSIWFAQTITSMRRHLQITKHQLYGGGYSNSSAAEVVEELEIVAEPKGGKTVGKKIDTYRPLQSYDKLIAIEFHNDNGLLFGLRVLDKKRTLAFALPGDQNIIIPIEALDWFRNQLTENGLNEGVDYHRVDVLNPTNENSLERSKLRIRNFGNKGRFPTIEEQENRIRELKKKLEID